VSKQRFDITAVIYNKRGRVLAIGKNSYFKTHPLQYKHACEVGLPEKQYLHAEIHAIARCRKLEDAHRIVVMRFDKSGKPCNAKPCPVCASAIQAAGIKVVEHT
jgi:tRNA(Arg) A34 adenosine deaminase TadA